MISRASEVTDLEVIKDVFVHASVNEEGEIHRLQLNDTRAIIHNQMNWK